MTFDKSSTMSGSDDQWRSCFTTDDYQSSCHMDSASPGDYFTMIFDEEQTFNGFRFECGGNGDSRNIEMNVFDIKYWDDEVGDWVTVASTDSADLICESTDSTAYAEWDAMYTSTQCRFELTEQHGGPWYHGFSW